MATVIPASLTYVSPQRELLRIQGQHKLRVKRKNAETAIANSERLGKKERKLMYTLQCKAVYFRTYSLLFAVTAALLSKRSRTVKFTAN